MHFEERVTINRPAEDVWAYLTDFFNAPRLPGGGMLGLRQTSPGPPGVGATLQGRMVILGFETRLNYQIAEWDPPRKVAYTVAGRPLRSVFQRLTVEATADGTRVVRSTEVELRPTFRLLLWPFVPFIRRQRRASFENAKRMFEAKAQ